MNSLNQRFSISVARRTATRQTATRNQCMSNAPDNRSKNKTLEVPQHATTAKALTRLIISNALLVFVANMCKTFPNVHFPAQSIPHFIPNKMPTTSSLTQVNHKTKQRISHSRVVSPQLLPQPQQTEHSFNPKF